MQNDVDPLSMTLSEIYGQPNHYFEPVPQYRFYSDSERLDRDGNIRTVYGGVILKDYGTQFFTIKEDDPRDHRIPEGQETHKDCILCESDQLEPDRQQNYWRMWNRLGEDDAIKRPHP